jgi:hypothetical protein
VIHNKKNGTYLETSSGCRWRGGGPDVEGRYEYLEQVITDHQQGVGLGVYTGAEDIF